MHTTFTGADLFDGQHLHQGRDLAIRDGRVTETAGTETVFLNGGTLIPGLLDLQVNGGAGHMIGAGTTTGDLRRLIDTHARLGATGILPTLITDTAEVTARLIDAAAPLTGTPGFLGLHLEGPHLDPRRKGAHDAALIRPMTAEDLDRLCAARKRLPALLVTLAPEAATPAQIATLSAAGIVVSLGHSDCAEALARAAIAAGATCATHLFNAMSQIGNRAPGLAGTALDAGLWSGLIADGHHVAPTTLRLAMAASPARLYLVSDCMAPAGSDMAEFALNGRRILRRDGRLTLTDGTLAGADLTLPQAIANLIRWGIPRAVAYAMATSRPAAVLNRPDLGHLRPGAPADFAHLGDDGSLRGVWRGGQRLL